MTKRPEAIPEAERRELMREGEAFAEALRRASFGAGDLATWIERAESDIEKARKRSPKARAIASRELVHKPVLLARLRAIARERHDRGSR